MDPAAARWANDLVNALEAVLRRMQQPINTIDAPYTVSNGTTDRTYDADATTVAELADIVYTLLSDLQSKGLAELQE